MTDAHEEKDTLQIDVYGPAHADRVATPLFEHSRGQLIEREHGQCWICGKTAEELGQPLEAHHMAIERQFAEAPLRWDVIKKDFPNFDWASFDPANSYAFIDNMLTQGLLLCKEHHTGKDTGIHNLPVNLWIMQRYLADGYKFTPNEVIAHDPQ